MVPSWIRFHCATMGTPRICVYPWNVDQHMPRRVSTYLLPLSCYPLGNRQRACRFCPRNSLCLKRCPVVLPFLRQEDIRRPPLAQASRWGGVLPPGFHRECKRARKSRVPMGEAPCGRWIDLMAFSPDTAQPERDFSSVVRDLPLASARGAFCQDLGPPGYFQELGL